MLCLFPQAMIATVNLAFSCYFPNFGLPLFAMHIANKSGKSSGVSARFKETEGRSRQLSEQMHNTCRSTELSTRPTGERSTGLKYKMSCFIACEISTPSPFWLSPWAQRLECMTCERSRSEVLRQCVNVSLVWDNDFLCVPAPMMSWMIPMLPSVTPTLHENRPTLCWGSCIKVEKIESAVQLCLRRCKGCKLLDMITNLWYACNQTRAYCFASHPIKPLRRAPLGRFSFKLRGGATTSTTASPLCMTAFKYVKHEEGESI